MTIADFLYGLGISAALTTALIFLVKAIYRATGKEKSKRIYPAAAQAFLDHRDRLLLNLKELDFDLAMKKISPEDHAEIRSELRTSLTQTMGELKSLGVDPETPSTSDGRR